MARDHPGAGRHFSLRSDPRVSWALRARRHDQHQHVRLDVLYPDRLSWPARAVWPRGAGCVARYRDEREARGYKAVRLRSGEHVLAFRGRGVGGDFHDDLSVAADRIAAAIRREAARRISSSKMAEILRAW